MRCRSVHWLVCRRWCSAYFGSQTNLDALDWYLRDVHPHVKAAHPDYRLRVAGRGLAQLPAHADENVDLVGEVSSLEAELAHAWVGIAPALGAPDCVVRLISTRSLGFPALRPRLPEGLCL